MNSNTLTWVSPPPHCLPLPFVRDSLIIYEWVSGLLMAGVVEWTLALVFLPRLLHRTQVVLGQVPPIHQSQPSESLQSQPAFWMVSLAQVRINLRQNLWLITFDLTDTYWYVPVHSRF